MIATPSLLERRGSVLEELLLPAIEHRRPVPHLVTQIRDGHSFQQMQPQDVDLFFRRAVLPLLLPLLAPLSYRQNALSISSRGTTMIGSA